MGERRVRRTTMTTDRTRRPTNRDEPNVTTYYVLRTLASAVNTLTLCLLVNNGVVADG